MQTIEEVRKHCRDVGRDIEKAVAAGMDLGEYFGGQAPMFRSRSKIPWNTMVDAVAIERKVPRGLKLEVLHDAKCQG